MTRQSDGTGGAPPDRPFAPGERTEAGEPAKDRAEARASTDKAEPEKAKTEIEAGDVADELADFA